MKTNTSYFHPIFFPTKVAIIDDDPDYLEQVGLLVNDDVICDFFTSPSKVLKALQGYEENDVDIRLLDVVCMKAAIKRAGAVTTHPLCSVNLPYAAFLVDALPLLHPTAGAAVGWISVAHPPIIRESGE